MLLPGLEATGPGFEVPDPGFEVSVPGFEVPVPGYEVPVPGFEVPLPGVLPHAQMWMSQVGQATVNMPPKVMGLLASTPYCMAQSGRLKDSCSIQQCVSVNACPSNRYLAKTCMCQ